jgi:hypothetical protein
MLDGDITEEYAYYFERLKEISIPKLWLPKTFR